MNKKSLNTRLKFEDTLLNLLQKETFTDITILQLCQYAELTRSSFYRNFKSLYDVVHFSAQRHIKELFATYQTNLDPDKRDLSVIKTIRESKKDYFLTLYKSGLFSIYIDEIKLFCKARFDNANIYKDERIRSYLSNHISYSIGSFLISMIENNFEDSDETITNAFKIIETIYSKNTAI